jgi:uncharacterized protein YbjT (DUF2867 family)
MKKTAIVFGATGLVGSFIVERLLSDDRYAQVKIFVRRTTGLQQPKLSEHVIRFEKLDAHRSEVTGDELYCCLGTTIRAAGSKDAFRRVDLEWVMWCATMAKKNAIPSFLVVSSTGADKSSRNFYLRTKGEMEKAVSAMKFEKCVIARPSMLLGSRKEFRIGELIGKAVMRTFGFLVPKRFKAIHAETVARALVHAANDPKINGVLENEMLAKIAK